MNNSHVGRIFAVLGALTTVAAGAARADSLDLNLNDDAARLTYARALAEGKLEVDFGWLHHQDKGDAVTVSLGRVGEAGGGTQAITAGLGGRLYLLEPDATLEPLVGPADPDIFPSPPPRDADQSGQALGIGGFFRFKLANYDRIGFSGHGYFAPDVLTFGDSEDLLEVEARVTYSIIREADVYLGLRYPVVLVDVIELDQFEHPIHASAVGHPPATLPAAVGRGLPIVGSATLTMLSVTTVHAMTIAMMLALAAHMPTMAFAMRTGSEGRAVLTVYIDVDVLRPGGRGAKCDRDETDGKSS